MDVISSYRDVGTYRGAAAICGTTRKTVRRIVEAHEAHEAHEATRVGEAPPVREPRERNFEQVADLVAEKVAKTAGKISAKRLLPAARAAGYEGSERNFRRLVADAKRGWRRGQARAGVMALAEIPQGRLSKVPTLGGGYCSGRRVPVAA